MSLPGSVQNQQLETVRWLRIFRSEEKKEFLKKIQRKRGGTFWYRREHPRYASHSLARKKKRGGGSLKTKRIIRCMRRLFSVLFQVKALCGRSFLDRGGGEGRREIRLLAELRRLESWRLRRFRGSGHHLAPSFRMAYRCVDGIQVFYFEKISGKLLSISLSAWSSATSSNMVATSVFG